MSEYHVYYIWSAYGITALVLLLEVILLLKRKRETKT